ncbi:hypothetical protein QFI66_014695 [Raoultella sp. BAC10a-01-01]|uniref:Uncharacterized protein n=1 Tax=Raoultella scottii TaxID=3040937 RepID=A0ABU8Z8B7_9ENTR
MSKISWLVLITCGVAASVGAAEKVSSEKVQSEIRYVGYECGRVDNIKPSSFGNEFTVTCDKVYKFRIRYERGGATVEVIS